MTHLPYIAASYTLAILVLGWFGIGSWVRVGAARRRLAAIDPRSVPGKTPGNTPGNTPIGDNPRGGRTPR
jgi:hypothetical protein